MDKLYTASLRLMTNLKIIGDLLQTTLEILTALHQVLDVVRNWEVDAAK